MCGRIVNRENVPFGITSKRFLPTGLHPKLGGREGDGAPPGSYDPNEDLLKTHFPNFSWSRQLRTKRFSATLGGKAPQLLRHRILDKKCAGPAVQNLPTFLEELQFKRDSIRPNIGLGTVRRFFNPLAEKDGVPGPARQVHSMQEIPLIRDKAFVNGAWVTASSSKKFKVTNPADGKVLGEVPDMDAHDTEAAIYAAAEAFECWKMTTAKERSELLRKWYNVLVKREKDLATLITAECGKPLNEAFGEVMYGNSFIEWFSEIVRSIQGEIIESPTREKKMFLMRQPIGVAALITPWNFPLAMIARKAGAALAAGCTCVVKPAEDTPFTALALAQLAEEAGLPNGVFNVITSDRQNAAAVGQILCESPQVAGISFTGSTLVGKTLYQQSASRVKRLGLELGGNAPFIVFESADLEKAVEGAMASKLRNCGQTCVSANRFLVHESLYEKFVDKMKIKMKALKMGNGLDQDVTLGPLINSRQAERVEKLVSDAVKKGACPVIGGKRAFNIGENYFEPTILININDSMDCWFEEIFGPVVVCIKFTDEEEAVCIANSTKSGLAGYFYSNNIQQLWRVAEQLELGMVGVNEGIISTAEAAFGGIKESGFGREGSFEGINEYLYTKYVCIGNLKY